MTRVVQLLLAVVVVHATGLLLVPAAALAQAPGQPPPLPMAVDLKKVPVGAWAEYDMTVGQLPPMKSRMALVGKSGETNTLEMTMQGGMLSMAGGKMIVQTVVDADQGKEKPVKRVIMQIGDNDPMEMPVDNKQQTQFHKPDPKSLVKEETPSGDPFDFWVSPDVPPFGIVKVEAEQKHAAGPAQGPVHFELTALGKDAKMTITKAAKPFNQGQMVGQLMGGAGKGSGGLVPIDTNKPAAHPAPPAK
jgi:hypothetical protein